MEGKVRKIKKTRATFERNNKYEKPAVEERVVLLRDDGKSWEEITEIVREEIDEPKMSNDMSKKIYNRAITRTIRTETRAGKKYKDHTEALDKMNGQMIRGLGGWVNAMDKLSEKLTSAVEDESMDAMQAYGIFLKTAPQMRSIIGAAIDIMKVAIEQQDKKTIEDKAQIWNEGQMMDYMDKAMKKLEHEGQIRWIKPKLV